MEGEFISLLTTFSRYYDDRNFCAYVFHVSAKLLTSLRVFLCIIIQGMGPRVLWIGIGGSIFFGVLEKTKQILSDQSSQEIHKA